MTQTVYYRCPKCDHEHAGEYDLGEHTVDVEANCLKCDHEFTNEEIAKIYANMEADAVGRAIDHATDRNR